MKEFLTLIYVLWIYLAVFRFMVILSMLLVSRLSSI